MRVMLRKYTRSVCGTLSVAQWTVCMETGHFVSPSVLEPSHMAPNMLRRNTVRTCSVSKEVLSEHVILSSLQMSRRMFHIIIKNVVTTMIRG